MNYGYDVNGRRIRETNKKLCQFCGKQTGYSLNDGTEINSRGQSLIVVTLAQVIETNR